MRDPDVYSAVLRDRGLDLGQRRILVSVLADSDQEPDLSEPVVCDGLGRIRHFHQETSVGWPPNPLPTVPAATHLSGDPDVPVLRALVYQNAICNWRCWYCYVPFAMLAGNTSRSRWASATQLVQLYLQLPERVRPQVIDLSGGQPDLVPEWTVWMLDALAEADLNRSVYLWGDDNLSNDYFFRHLSDTEIARVADAPNYGRVCCLKGFDPVSFSFNTAAPSPHFERQFNLLRRLVGTGIDLYCYATFTTPVLPQNPQRTMAEFFDRLQAIDSNLPLRLVPLEISIFGPVEPRLTDRRRAALSYQETMVVAWQTELENRFTEKDRAQPICNVPLRAKPNRRNRQ
jgi:uncharacterized Fe-S cluster-containing radical SAM superfamily protein